MTAEQLDLLNGLEGLICDVNPTEIADHIKHQSLSKWCSSWQCAAKTMINAIRLEDKTE